MSRKPELEIVSRTPWETRLFHTLEKGRASLAVQFGAAMDMRKVNAGEITGEDVIRNATRKMEAEASAGTKEKQLKEYVRMAERLNATEDEGEALDIELALEKMAVRLNMPGRDYF